MALTVPTFPGVFTPNMTIGIVRYTDPPFVSQEAEAFLFRPWVDMNDLNIGTEAPGPSRYFFRYRSLLYRLIIRSEWVFTSTRSIGDTTSLEDLLITPDKRPLHVLDSIRFADEEGSLWFILAAENQSPANTYPAGILDVFD